FHVTPSDLNISSCLFLFFFFSSRRRHTRSDRDWSSDVCSSDLAATDVLPVAACPGGPAPGASSNGKNVSCSASESTGGKSRWKRSEERRVGKEGGEGGWRNVKKKKRKDEC